MASKYDKERQAIGIVSGGTGKSKYDGERQLMNPTIKYGSVDQRAGSARARADAEADQARKNAVTEREQRERQQFQAGARAISQPVVEPKKKSFGNKVLDVGKSVVNNVNAFADAGANAMTFGLHNKILEHNEDTDRIDNQKGFAGGTGRFTGEAIGVGKAYNLTTRALKPITSRLPNLADNAIKPLAGRLSPTAGALSRVGAQNTAKGAGLAAQGALGGALYQTAVEGGEAAFGINKQSLPQRAGDIGGAAAFGAVFDPVADNLLGAIGSMIRRRGVPEETVQEVLALPAGPQRGNPNRANPPRVIVDADTRPVGLPEPNVLPPTTARTGQVVNPYRQKFESLIAQAKRLEAEGRLTPGREDEDLRSLWSQMAEPNDPNLDDLIDLAYKPRPNRLSPGLVGQARQTQNMRAAAGVPPVVRSMEDRYRGGVIGSASAPTQRVGRAPGTPLREAAARTTIEPPQQVLQASAPPSRPRVDVTPELQSVENTVPPKQDWFSRLFGKQGVGITPGAKSGKELIDTHIVDRPRAQSSLLNRVGEAVSNTNQNLVDRFTPFKLINKETYDAAMDSTRANNLANVTIKDKFVDLEGNVRGKSLKDVYANVPRGEKHIADRYVIMRDAVSRMDRGLKVYGNEAWFPKSAAEAQTMVAQLEARYPWVKNFGDDWNQFNRNRQDMWVQSGIASKELVDTLRHTNPNYAPMFRQQDATSLRNRLAFNTAKSGFSGQKAPVKRAVGSSRKIVDPAQGMIETTGTSYNAMMRNRAMMNIYDAVKANPERFKGVIEVVEESADMKHATLRRINEALEENGPDGIAEMLNDELTNIFKKSSQATSKNEAIVTVMVNGNPVKMRVADPSLLKAIEGVSPEQLGAITKVFDFISRGIKYAATGGAAPFQGLKLALRDLPIAFAQSQNKLRFSLDVSHALVSQVADWLPDFVPGAQRLGKMAREYYRAGGGYEAYLKGDSRIRAVSSDITRDPILSRRNLWKTAKMVNPFRPLKGFGDAMENIPRIAAFNAEMRKAGWKRDPETVRRAVEAAREATVNWSRRGYRGAEIESFLPYSNAAVQGTYRLVKRFKEQPISAIALIMGIAGAKIAAYEQFKNDPDYQYRSKFEKGIPISKRPDGKFEVIPVEPTEAFIADQVLNFYKWATDGQKAPNAKETIQEGADAFLPKYVSGPAASLTQQGKPVDFKAGLANLTGGSAFEPINAVVTGKNFFGGDIVPREYQVLPTDLQYNETTSAAGKWAAENLGIDAFTFDYIGQKFGGDLAKVGLPMTSDVGKGDPLGNIVDEALTRLKLLEDPVMKNRIADEFYSYSNAVSQAKAASTHKDISLPAWYQKAYDEVTSQKKNSLSSRISELNGTKKDIQRDISLSAKERADQLREVQSQMNLLRIQGIKRLEELGVPKKGN